MNYRSAVASDAPHVVALWNRMIRETLWTFTTAEKSVEGIAAQIAAAAQGPSGFFVAEVEGVLAGFVTYAQFRNGPGYARSMEHSIIVDDSLGLRGVGRALMAVAEEDARAKGHGTMVAGVSSANPRGRAFHEAIGYSYVGTMKRVGYKWDQWLDLHLLQKLL